MHDVQIGRLRHQLALSRSDLARFVGVSEATVVRWESSRDSAEPHGLQAVLLSAMADAAIGRPAHEVTRTVRLSGVSHSEAIITLLDAAG